VVTCSAVGADCRSENSLSRSGLESALGHEGHQVLGEVVSIRCYFKAGYIEEGLAAHKDFESEYLKSLLSVRHLCRSGATWMG
jgi:hypothetical protein